MKKVFFKTFGCRTNQFDTQVMIESLKDFEVVRDESCADIVVVNSCSVTNRADSSTRSYINRLNREKKRVYIGGCGAISKGKSLFDAKKVAGVFGHSKKESLNELLKRDERFVEFGDLESLDSTIVENFSGKSRAFIKIQEGCDFECSYCIIPSLRGRARSQSESLILEQIKKLIDNGFSEFILTGTNVGSYGKDIDSSLAKLTEKILKISGVRRIRFGSLEPSQITLEFRELLKEAVMERHLHIAIQHSSNQMLKIMNRKNQFESDLELFEDISKSGFAIGTDYIVGHPSESEDIWQEAMQNLKLMPLTHIHSFIYSKRDGTKSANMKNLVNPKVAKTRQRELNSIIEQKAFKFKSNLKSELIVLIESFKDGFYSGFDQFFNRVEIESDRDIVKEWVRVENFNLDGNRVYAKI